VKVYTDLYSFPVPIVRRIKKLLRRNRRRIIIGTVVFASISTSLVLLSLTAKNYVERETLRSYNRIAALKDLRDLDTISREIHEIHGSFNTITLIFSPFRAILDNRFYSHPQVHLASNVIHGGLSLSESIKLSLSTAQKFVQDLPKDGKCTISSFFGSGTTTGTDC
jgi:hypothetical protein